MQTRGMPFTRIVAKILGNKSPDRASYVCGASSPLLMMRGVSSVPYAHRLISNRFLLQGLHHAIFPMGIALRMRSRHWLC